MESKKSRKLLIAGSARKDGGVAELIEFFLKHSDWDVVDLNDYQFSYYDYDHANREDDFIPLIRTIVEKYDTWIFLTPVYWYAMSGIMKVFFDRFTDLLEIEKPLGRQLRKIKMAAISSCGN
jgi:multimeric flavodoxin WrbA